VPLGNCRGVIALAVISHPERKLRVEVSRVFRQNLLQPPNRPVEIARSVGLLEPSSCRP